MLALLLYAAFLLDPFTDLAAAFRQGRFLAAVLSLNFLVVALVVLALLPVVPEDRAVLLGALLVLLAPCVDYVSVFIGLTGGLVDRLLAAAPLLMLAQLALLPVYLLLFVGRDLVDLCSRRSGAGAHQFARPARIISAGPGRRGRGWRP